LFEQPEKTWFDVDRLLMGRAVDHRHIAFIVVNRELGLQIIDKLKQALGPTTGVILPRGDNLKRRRHGPVRATDKRRCLIVVLDW
jgi:hypothetical protein